MQVPAQIVFRNCEPSDEIRIEVDKQVSRLEQFSSRITSCHVVVRGPKTRHRQGDLFEVELRLAMPQGQDIVVTRRHGDRPEDEHPLVAIRHAFTAARRQIEDAVRDSHGQAKVHAAPGNGRVARFVAGEDYGFIETSDGRELYFHRNAVHDNRFDQMHVGDRVHFSETEGEDGPQAGAVRLIGRPS